MVQRALLYMKNHQYQSAIDLLDLAIGCDNTRAMVVRDIMYEKGLGTEANIDEAIKLLEIAIRAGNMTALYNRALIYEEFAEYFIAVALSEQILRADDRLLKLQEGADGYLTQFEEIKMFDEDRELFSSYARTGFFRVQPCSAPAFMPEQGVFQWRESVKNSAGNSCES
jgi:tetratricopeptide (TPR) repeat protein